MVADRSLPAGTPASPPRAVALSVLLSCQAGDGAPDELLEQIYRRARYDVRDRALAMELVYGVLRRQERLEWRLAPILTKPIHRLPAVVHMLLCLGAYQLLYLDRIPASAAVDETVHLTKSYAKKLGRDWSGLVNAVLRNVIRLPEPPLPDPNHHPVEALSVRYALPQWLCRRWLARLGFQAAEAACRSTTAIPSVTLRVNRRRLSRQDFLDRLRQGDVAARPTTISPVGVILEGGHAITSIPGFFEGDFYVEDEAAQLIPLLLDAQPGEIVLDACAAPGGKTTHLAELMDDRGCILAMDRQEKRLQILRDNCGRLGVSTVVPITGDARNPTEALRILQEPTGSGQPRVSVDRILLDAPCSGLGVLRRHPEAKLKKYESMFPRHQALQLEILTAVAAVLRPGGVLVYSTCSTEPEETEVVVGRFCDGHRSWVRDSVAPWLPSAALPFITAGGALSTLGNDCGMDSFYAARLRKIS